MNCVAMVTCGAGASAEKHPRQYAQRPLGGLVLLLLCLDPRSSRSQRNRPSANGFSNDDSPMIDETSYDIDNCTYTAGHQSIKLTARLKNLKEGTFDLL